MKVGSCMWLQINVPMLSSMFSNAGYTVLKIAFPFIVNPTKGQIPRDARGGQGPIPAWPTSGVTPYPMSCSEIVSSCIPSAGSRIANTTPIYPTLTSLSSICVHKTVAPTFNLKTVGDGVPENRLFDLSISSCIVLAASSSCGSSSSFETLFTCVSLRACPYQQIRHLRPSFHNTTHTLIQIHLLVHP